MRQIVLSGHLVCADDEELTVVQRHLPLHKELTRSERGCLSFEVRQTRDPLVWQIEEAFVDNTAFVYHQERVANSEWGRTTAGIERRYKIVSQESSD